MKTIYSHPYFLEKKLNLRGLYAGAYIKPGVFINFKIVATFKSFDTIQSDCVWLHDCQYMKKWVHEKKMSKLLSYSCLLQNGNFGLLSHKRETSLHKGNAVFINDRNSFYPTPEHTNEKLISMCLDYIEKTKQDIKNNKIQTVIVHTKSGIKALVIKPINPKEQIYMYYGVRHWLQKGLGIEKTNTFLEKAKIIDNNLHSIATHKFISQVLSDDDES